MVARNELKPGMVVEWNRWDGQPTRGTVVRVDVRFVRVLLDAHNEAWPRPEDIKCIVKEAG